MLKIGAWWHNVISLHEFESYDYEIVFTMNKDHEILKHFYLYTLLDRYVILWKSCLPVVSLSNLH